VPAEVGRVEHDAAGVDDAGRADADAEDRLGGAGDQLVGELVHEVLRGLTVAPLQRALDAGDHLAGEVDDRAEDAVVGGEVEGDDVGRVGRDADQGRRLADTALDRCTELLDQSLGHHLAHQVRHRHAGQPGGPGQVRPARRTIAEQRLQQQRAVVPTGILLQQLAAGSELPADRRYLGHIS
jgi:hypothetical protein